MWNRIIREGDKMQVTHEGRDYPVSVRWRSPSGQMFVLESEAGMFRVKGGLYTAIHVSRQRDGSFIDTITDHVVALTERSLDVTV